jgi:hypothetical protein
MQAFLYCFHSRRIPTLVLLSTSYKGNFLRIKEIKNKTSFILNFLSSYKSILFSFLVVETMIFDVIIHTVII